VDPQRRGALLQAHDIGGALFMLPAAAIGAIVSAQPAAAQIKEPPWVSRFLVALSYALLGAAGCLFVFRLFATLCPPRPAFLLSLAFAVATPFLAYIKSSYDVLGACVGVCVLLALCAEASERGGDRLTARDVVKMALTFVVACSFRFTLAPFLAAGFAAFLYLLARQGKLSPWHATVCAATIAAGMLPGLAYNAVRTAVPIRTAATGQYPPSLALRGDILDGLQGLLFSPNRGLLWFAPVFLLLPVLPLVWRRVEVHGRRLILCFGVSTIAYTAAIAKLNNWAGVGGWGPRYLVPILPILFLATGMILLVGWPGRWRPVLCALVLCSAVLNAVPVLVNHSLASWGHAGSLDPRAPLPRQQIAAWDGLRRGLRGEPLPAPAGVLADPVRRLQRRFPDLWWARLIEYSGAGAAAGAAAVLFLGAAAARSLGVLLAVTPEATHDALGSSRPRRER
jgi:hypothetical protein